MLKNCIKFIFCLFAAMTILIAPANACTVFRIADGDNVLFGNNEDWVDKDTYVWFLPSEAGKYGRVFFGFQNAWPQGGMNTAGLAFDWFAGGSNLAPSDPSKPDYPGLINDELMEKCSTVEEAVAIFETYNCRDLGYAEILLSDKSGASASVTWDWKSNKVSVTRNQGSCQVIGSGIKGANKQFDVYKIVNKLTAREMLRAASNATTLYSGIYDLKSGDMTIFKFGDYKNSVNFNLSDELKKGKHLYYIQDLFGGQKREGPDQLKPYMVISASQLVFLAALTLICSVSAILRLLRFAGRKVKHGAEVVLLASSLIGGLSVIAEALFLYFNGAFALKYGSSILGFLPRALPWAIVTTAAVQLALIAPVLRLKDIAIRSKIHNALMVLIDCLAVIALLCGKLILT